MEGMSKTRMVFLFILILLNIESLAVDIRVKIGEDDKSFTITGQRFEYHVLGQSMERKGIHRLRFVCPQKSPQTGIYAEINPIKGRLYWKRKSYIGRFTISINPKGKCELINVLNIEDYISMVLAKEMHPNWPIEALKAQAVAARSYALYQIMSREVIYKVGYDAPYDLENSEQFQVNGLPKDRSLHTIQAMLDTRGEVLLSPSMKNIPIFYHSKCGGSTTLPKYVWGKSIEGYKSVQCPYCSKHGKRPWSYEVSKNKIVDILRKIDDRSANLATSPESPQLAMNDDTIDSRFLKIFLPGGESKSYSKASWRKALGWKKIFSNYYKATDQGNSVVFQGRGHGHRVGMCQFGAYEMALKGKNYTDILSYYYPEFKKVIIQ